MHAVASPARRTGRSPRNAPPRQAFTLVELLVVIGIIALLISILLPALSKARKSANTVACASNLSQIGLGMLMYANQYKGAIPGSPWTSGAFVLPGPGGSNPSDANGPIGPYNCPSISQSWDWEAPIAKMMGIKFDEGFSLADRTQRFDYLCRLPAFQCPDNDVVAAPDSASQVKVTTKMISYNTNMWFLYIYGSPQNMATYGGDVTTDNHMYPAFQTVDTGSYTPKLPNVGDTSSKIYMFDGGRWTSASGVAPNYQCDYNGSGSSPGGHYADPGPFSAYTRAFLPGTPVATSMRHGNRVVSNSAAVISSYRFNALFFDGHVATLDGRAGMNPRLYVPKGSSVAVTGETELSPQAVTWWGGNGSDPIIVNN